MSEKTESRTKGGEIMDIHALLFKAMNEQQSQTEDNVSKKDNNRAEELQHIKSALDILDRARTERKNETMLTENKQNGMTDLERKSYECAKQDVQKLTIQNQALRDRVNQLVNELADMKRRAEQAEKQNGVIVITSDTVSKLLDRVASVTFRK